MEQIHEVDVVQRAGAGLADQGDGLVGVVAAPDERGGGEQAGTVDAGRAVDQDALAVGAQVVDEVGEAAQCRERRCRARPRSASARRTRRPRAAARRRAGRRPRPSARPARGCPTARCPSRPRVAARAAARRTDRHAGVPGCSRRPAAPPPVALQPRRTPCSRRGSSTLSVPRCLFRREGLSETLRPVAPRPRTPGRSRSAPRVPTTPSRSAAARGPRRSGRRPPRRDRPARAGPAP